MMARLLIPALAAIALSACTSTSQRTSVNVGYYDVRGTTFKQLDQQIALHGPTVEGVGKAVASTSINMVPDIRFRETSEGCVVSRSKIRVQANVILPRLTDRKLASRELRPAFSNIERYAKEHEAVHVEIADKYAARAEREIANLPMAKDCKTLRADAVRTFESIMKKHRAEQLAYDVQEKQRFAAAENS